MDSEIRSLINNHERKPNQFKLFAFVFLFVFGVISIASITLSTIAIVKLNRNDTCKIHPLTCNDQLQEKQYEIFQSTRVLVIVAHPDDAETTSGGNSKTK